MKKTLAVAKNELYFLFFSPIAWVMMILFVVLCAGDYITPISGYAAAFQRGGPSLMWVTDLTDRILYGGGGGLFPQVLGNVYLFLPLLTMGLISRETNNGTIKLLYSSSLRIGQIVFGKYLAMLVFLLCFMVLAGLLVITTCVLIINPDFEYIVAAMFGLFLVLAAYAAIGLFISALTSYQIVAAIVTIGVFALLSRIGMLWQEIDLVRHVTFYLNIGSKARNLLEALLNLRDIMYFLILIGSFLAFTIIRLRSSMEYISKWRKTFRYLAVIAVAMILGYITSQPRINMYYDATRFKLRTIAPHTQEVLKSLNEGKLEITTYANLLDMVFSIFTPQYENYVQQNVWEAYIRFKPDITFKTVYYYDTDSTSYHYKQNPGKTLKEIAQKQAKTYKMKLDRFLPPEEINKIVNIREEEFRNFFIVKYKGRSTILHTFDDQRFWPGENEIAAAINRLVGIPPMISFLSDEIERSPYSERPRDYKRIASKVSYRRSLRNQGYDFDTLSLRRRDIPKDIMALVIADPRTPFTAEGLAKISKYVDEGGNLYIATEPDRKEIIQPVLDKLGLSLRPGMLIQPSAEYSSNTVFSELSPAMKNIAPQFARKVKEDTKYFGDTIFRVAMTGASALEYQEKDGFAVTPLMYSNGTAAWNRTLPVNMDSVELKMAPHPTDENGRFITSLRMERQVNGRHQQVFVFGDADFLTTPEMNGQKPMRYNFEASFWLFSRFSEGKFPANTLSPESIDNAIKIRVRHVKYLKMIFYWIIPAIIGVIGAVFLLRRKRK